MPTFPSSRNASHVHLRDKAPFWNRWLDPDPRLACKAACLSLRIMSSTESASEKIRDKLFTGSGVKNGYTFHMKWAIFLSSPLFFRDSFLQYKCNASLARQTMIKERIVRKYGNNVMLSKPGNLPHSPDQTRPEYNQEVSSHICRTHRAQLYKTISYALPPSRA